MFESRQHGDLGDVSQSHNSIANLAVLRFVSLIHLFSLKLCPLTLPLISRFRPPDERWSAALVPFVRPTLDFLFPVTVSFLYDTQKFIVVSFCLKQIIVCQLAPFFLHLA